MADLLELKHLSVGIDTPAGTVEAVRDVSFTLKAGEVLAIVGESGCGKSMLCKSIMKLLPKNARIQSGSILADGTDITHYNERAMRALRGRLFSMVFQDPLTALNPTLTVGRQIAEAVRVHDKKLTREAVYERVIELMELTGIQHPRERYDAYPHSFSGGMRQRCVLAMALAGNPRILLADEPTTALDVSVQAQILDLLRDIQQKLGTATILVSHDLGVVARAADRVAIMYAGKIVEIGTAEEIYYDPQHPYTWGLLRSLPALAKSGQKLYTIPGMPPTLIDPPKGDAFACRNEYALAIDYEEQPPMFRISDTHYAATWLLDERAPKITRPGFHSAEAHAVRPDNSTAAPVLVDVKNLSHTFKLGKKMYLKAVDNVSFQIRKGEIFGLVGESGSGKSTIARCIMDIYRPTGGEILYPTVPSGQKLSRQIIFQDCASSLNPRMKVADIITEPMRISRSKIFAERFFRRNWDGHSPAAADGSRPRLRERDLIDEAAFQLHYVGMDASYLNKYPTELSGGQRQRVAIARALTMKPELLVADEPVSSLDVSIQAQIINLFAHLRKEHGFSILFIAHDLAIVRYLCDRVGVMYNGRLVEVAKTKTLFSNPQHPYTKALLSAIPVPDPAAARK